MNEQGKVVQVTENKAVIKVLPKETCTKCCSCGAARPRRIIIEGDKASGLKLGDEVNIDIDSSSMFKLYCLLYGLPLIAFIAGILVLYAIFRSPIISFAGAIFTTVLTCVLVGHVFKNKPEFMPNICQKD